MTCGTIFFCSFDAVPCMFRAMDRRLRTPPRPPRCAPGKKRIARRPISRVLSPPSGFPAGQGMAIHLGRPSPDASRDRPGRRRGNASAGRSRRAAPIWSCSRWGLPCRCRCRQRGGLLHRRFTLATRLSRARSAVCFLLHCPWGCPRRALPGTLLPWSPDFPRRGSKAWRGHPAIWQARM